MHGARKRTARRLATRLAVAIGALAAVGVAAAAPVTIPVGIVEWPPGTTPPAMQLTAEIDWLAPGGSLAKPVAGARVVNGAIRVDVPPIEPGLRWGIVIRESGAPGPVFRSGPLTRLPTSAHVPPLTVFDGSISIVRESFASDPLFDADFHLADRIRQAVAGVPGAWPLDVSLAAAPGTWTVTVGGPFWSFSQPFGLAPATDVGHPETVIVAQPQGAGTLHTAFPFMSVPTAGIRVAEKSALEAFLAGYGYFLPPPPFTPTTYSVSHVDVGSSNGSLGLRLNGGRVNGPPVVIRPMP